MSHLLYGCLFATVFALYCFAVHDLSDHQRRRLSNRTRLVAALLLVLIVLSVGVMMGFVAWVIAEVL